MKVLGYMYHLISKNLSLYFKPYIVPKNEDIVDNSIHWVGHATSIIKIDESVIVTDPVTSSFIGFIRRKVRPSKNLSNIKIDYILFSHCHMDHLDIFSLLKLNKKAVIITAPGYKFLFKVLGFKNCYELNPGEIFDDGVIKIEAFKANHDGRRYYFIGNASSNSYKISKNGKSVFFAGDTSYTPLYKGIESDICLMPVGCYKPDEYLELHCSPEQSFKMFKMMKSKSMVPIHYKTFILAQDDDETTDNILKKLNDGSIKIIDIGETIKIPISDENC